MRGLSSKEPLVVAVDLFCGVGGLSLGLRRAGIRIGAGIDLDPACQFPFLENIRAPFLLRDVSEMSGQIIGELFEGADVRVLAACAPCQPFSGYTAKLGRDDQRWRLLLEVLRITRELRPHIVTVENVARLARTTLWQMFVSELRRVGYYVDWKVLDSSHYGVPQRRRRVVLVASLLGELKVPSPIKGEIRTVADAIAHLPEVAPGRKNDVDPLHSARALTPKNLSRIRRSKPAGTWREWPARLRVKCHRRASGRTYPSVYGRMSWDDPSPTITTQFYGFGNGRFGHPTQDRAITLREGALLQSFPSSFVFLRRGERLNFRAVGRLIGNAVPPALGYSIGRAIVAHAAAAVGSGSRKPPASR